MHDIFISYSRKDVVAAEKIAQKLEKEGFSVWWDRQIPAGKSFDEVIEKAIDDSKCVLILWSNDSVKSQWARTEAAEGQRRGILVPILIEDVQIPLAFRNIQAANLIDWDDARSNIHFVNLNKDIRSIILERKKKSGRGIDAEEQVSSLKVSAQKRTKLKTPIIALGVIAVLVLVTWVISKYITKSDDNGDSIETKKELANTPNESAFWLEMRKINSDSSYKAYQVKYPSGIYDSIAQLKIDSIVKKNAIVPRSEKLDDVVNEKKELKRNPEYTSARLLQSKRIKIFYTNATDEKGELLKNNLDKAGAITDTEKMLNDQMLTNSTILFKPHRKDLADYINSDNFLKISLKMSILGSTSPYDIEIYLKQ